MFDLRFTLAICVCKTYPLGFVYAPKMIQICLRSDINGVS